MKPSRRSDSLEKAARKEVGAFLESMLPARVSELFEDELSLLLLRLLERHGAKVRRETLKPFVDAVKRSEDDLQRLSAEHPIHQDQCTIVSVIGRLQRVLKEISLTPRGPEKGRREK